MNYTPYYYPSSFCKFLIDDHTIKLTYTTWREWQRSSDIRYIEALQIHYEFPDSD